MLGLGRGVGHWLQVPYPRTCRLASSLGAWSVSQTHEVQKQAHGLPPPACLVMTSLPQQSHHFILGVVPESPHTLNLAGEEGLLAGPSEANPPC